MYKPANLSPPDYYFILLRASTTERLDEPSATPSIDQIACEIKPNMVFHCLRPLSLSPLALNRFIVRKGGNMARPFSDVKIIPIVGYKHPSDVPSEEALSRLRIFGRWCDVPNIHTEQKQGSDWRSQEAQQQEGKEAQKKDNRNATGNACHGGSEGGGGDHCTPRDPSEQNGHGREHADTLTGSEASAHETSSGSVGGCDGGDGADGGGCDGGL